MPTYYHALLDPIALNELIPDWKSSDIPVTTEVKSEAFSFLTSNNHLNIPSLLLPQDTKNEGNYIISLGNLCKWLGKYAESLGVDIFPGFTAKDILFENDKVKGVITGEKGIDKYEKKTELYEGAIALKARQTIFAEGCRGHLGKKLIKKFKLYDKNQFQTYALGLKELWEVNNNTLKKGDVFHSIGWPLYNNAYGGSFIYKLSDTLLSIGFVVGLDYKNPYLNPYEEFQKFKTHKKIKAILNNGNRIS